MRTRDVHPAELGWVLDGAHTWRSPAVFEEYYDPDRGAMVKTNIMIACPTWHDLGEPPRVREFPVFEDGDFDPAEPSAEDAALGAEILSRIEAAIREEASPPRPTLRLVRASPPQRSAARLRLPLVRR